MKSITKNSIWLFLVAALIGMPASALAVTFFIGSGDIQSGAVQTDHIAPYAVTNDKIAPSTITQDKLAFTLPSGSHYANVVVVAKSGGDFTDPIAAVASITDASADRPYLVKIMPGKYDLLGASLQMKEYVDVEGSGPDNTIIISSSDNGAGNICEVGTVQMANNSSIRHIKVVNTAPDLGGDYITVAAITFNNVAAKAEGISVLTGSDTAVGGQNDGICTSGSAAHAILNNVYIETHNLAGQSNAIITMGGKVTLTNSKLVSYNQEHINVINDNSGGASSTVTVINSTIEGNSSTTATGIFAGDNKVLILNSSVILNVGASGGAEGFHATGEFSMANSKIVSDNPVVTYGASGNIKIATSLLMGSDNLQLPNVKLVHNYNENYVAILDR